jgi:hypothetical protein
VVLLSPVTLSLPPSLPPSQCAHCADLWPATLALSFYSVFPKTEAQDANSGPVANSDPKTGCLELGLFWWAHGTGPRSDHRGILSMLSFSFVRGSNPASDLCVLSGCDDR